ncbi:MAG: 50S ribosomal protein L17 [Proteobacteria bacterium]|nr:50S ribosomal protein L17 [Pseudomonadota bacterium]
MRHKHGYRKLGRDSAHRRALLRNLATSLITHERITTTLPKAKELRSVVEKMVTLGKKGSLHHRRQAGSYLFDKEAVVKVFGDLASRFKDRQGGYVRILKRGIRVGDGAKMALIEFVDFEPKKAAAAE